MAIDAKSKHLREAERFVLQGKVPQAIAEYLKVVRDDPADVLTLNTVGDLYLRQGKIHEAHKYFTLVADTYARNNFLLKAIAVYKKILLADPDNLLINLTLANLYARQGNAVEAKLRYLKVANLSQKEGTREETLEAYQKVADLDPTNAEVQLKLADMHLETGQKDQAFTCLMGAAEAHTKLGDIREAAEAFRRAVHLKPLDHEALGGYLESCLQLGDPAPVLEQVQRSLAQAPDDPSLLEFLGRACMARGDHEGAFKAFEKTLAQDELRYQHFLLLSEKLQKAGDLDRAVTCLDPIIPVLIGRRETEKALEVYHSVLAVRPRHIPSLKRAAEIHSATNDQHHYLESLDRIAFYSLEAKSPLEAMEALEKILLINPSSASHLEMHQRAFAEAHPGEPYRSPVPGGGVRASMADLIRSEGVQSLDRPGEEGLTSQVVEVDLLLNYGMKDKALNRLQELERRDPESEEVRTRLLGLYRDAEQLRQAAQECVLLAAILRKSDDEKGAQRYLAEARRLDPDWATPDFDVAGFARQRGIIVEDPEGVVEEDRLAMHPGIEVDLSGDISDMFFGGPVTETEAAEVEPAAIETEPMPEALATEVPSRAEGTLDEELQEVDFYIRLGFFEEARTKLDEIARHRGDCPELAERYSQLSPGGEPVAAESPSREADAIPGAPESEETGFAFVSDLAEDLSTGGDAGPAAPEPVHSSEVQAAETPDRGDEFRSMFADLLDTVETRKSAQTPIDEFETRFNLGIAYREMDLLEDAIKEFESAYETLDPEKTPKEAIQCCGMLSTCYLDKGVPDSAIRWCRTGLSLSAISPHEALALRYDMGVAHTLTGETESALECFDSVLETDPIYRDVAQRIDLLRSGLRKHGS